MFDTIYSYYLTIRHLPMIIRGCLKLIKVIEILHKYKQFL